MTKSKGNDGSSVTSIKQVTGAAFVSVLLGFVFMTLIDLMWFWIAKKYSSLSEGMELVAGWYVFFDKLTLLAFIGFFLLEGIWGPWPRYLPQWLVLAVLLGLGSWDLKALWQFYAGAPDWQASLKKGSSRRHR